MTLSRLTALLLPFALLAATLPAQTAAPQNTVIESDHFEMQSTGNDVVSNFTGRVTVTGTNLKLTCDRLDVVAVRKPDTQAAIGQTEQFKSLVATGNVRLIQGDREVVCGKAYVLPGENRLILEDRPVIVDRAENWTGIGERIELHRANQQVVGTKFRFIGPALKDLGFDRDKLFKADAPTTTAPAPAEAPKQP